MEKKIYFAQQNVVYGRRKIHISALQIVSYADIIISVLQKGAFGKEISTHEKNREQVLDSRHCIAAVDGNFCFYEWQLPVAMGG